MQYFIWAAFRPAEFSDRPHTSSAGLESCPYHGQIYLRWVLYAFFNIPFHDILLLCYEKCNGSNSFPGIIHTPLQGSGWIIFKIINPDAKCFSAHAFPLVKLTFIVDGGWITTLFPIVNLVQPAVLTGK
jgi:hypothetical protein